jgi:alpha-L-arabinofuranosidase
MKQLVLLIGISMLNAAEIRVDLAQAGNKVSPHLFGLFLEEINHAGDGGLYAELIRNGSFSEAPTLDAWAAVRSGAARVNLFFDTSMPLNAVKSRSLRVEVNSPGEARAGVSNEGYWGIAAKQGTSYEFSTYARAAAGFEGPLTITLEGSDGAVYGQTQITDLKTTWNRFTGAIQSSGTNPAARLTISTNRSGAFWLNMVSLRPGKDIFRADLLEKLKDLKPAFVRFPGGTYVQGNDRESAFRWKKTIGDLELRPGHQNAPWVYWSTDNMGYHEYLLLCERLGAVPMYVAYGGMTWTPNSKSPFGVLQNHKIPVSDFPLDQMGPIVQETLDAIEYANGPVTSTWGALRAKAGHPAPFGLKYVEIGNEDGGNPLYSQRYMLFYGAIKARFPEIQIISNARRGGNEPLPMDLLDEHTYTRPLAAIDMGKRLDSRERTGARSVLAEYAVQTSAGFGNLRAALAEAVMLSGVERNSDVMPMASYAPLLAHVRSINWRPDLIYFDGVSSYGTPSYYVQKMFADSRLDAVVPVQVNASELKVRMEGKTSAEGYGAQVEFQDEKVTGSGENYTYSVRALKSGGDGGFVVRFAIQDGGGSYLAWFAGVRHRASTLHVWGGGGLQDVPAHQLESSFGGALGRGVNGTLDSGRWYDVKIQVEGRRVRCYLDGKEIQDVQVPESLGPSVYGSAGRTAGGDVVVRLVNASPLKQSVDIVLAGAGADRYSAVATQLTAKNLDDENSLADPTRIAPIDHQLPGVGNKFQYELEGNSFTVLKLAPQRR